MAVGALLDLAHGDDVGLLLMLQLAQVQLPWKLVQPLSAHGTAHGTAHQTAGHGAEAVRTGND